MNKYEQAHWETIKNRPNVTATLTNAIANPGITRRYIAGLYAISLRLDFGQTDWETVNHAIIERWSLSALKRIKKLAWQAIEQAVTV